MPMNNRVAFLFPIAVFAIGCSRGGITGSGFFRPPLPKPQLYQLAEFTPPDGLARVGGVRVDSERRTRIYVDILAVEPLGEAHGALTKRLHSESCNGRHELVELRADGKQISLTPWRTAMHRRSPNLNHLSLHACETVTPLPSGSSLRTASLVTLAFEIDPDFDLFTADSIEARLAPLQRTAKALHWTDPLFASPPLEWQEGWEPVEVRPAEESTR